VTTVIIEVGVKSAKIGDFSIMGNVDKKSTEKIKISVKAEEMQLLSKMCRMMEKQETFLKGQLDSVYLGKSKEVLPIHS